jgi:hypothetical protein
VTRQSLRDVQGAFAAKLIYNQIFKFACSWLNVIGGGGSEKESIGCIDQSMRLAGKRSRCLALAAKELLFGAAQKEGSRALSYSIGDCSRLARPAGAGGDSRGPYSRRPMTRTMAVRNAPLTKAAAHWLTMARQSSKPLRTGTVN